MALVVKDRVRETSTSTGTGDLILNGAVQAFQDFSVIGDGNTTYYTIVDATTGAWEVGLGTYTLSTTTLSRDTVLESSDGGTAVNFAANTKDVFVTYPAERSIYVDGGAISPATAARLGFNNLAQGSGLSVLGVTGSTTANVASIAAGTDHQVFRRSGSSVSFGPVALDQSAAVAGLLPVVRGGSGAGTLTGYLQGNGTAAFTASATIPNTDITGLGTMSTQNANNVNITGGSISGITDLAIADGGTGASTASAALANLGGYPASNPDGYTSNTGTVTSVSGTGTVNGISLSGTVNTSGNITLGGALSGVSLTSQVTGTLPIANGGTNATTAAGARSNLGLGSIATQNANSVNIDGGSIDGTPVGTNTASTGDFTNLSYSGTLTGGTGVINIGSGQVYKDADGKVGVGTSNPQSTLDLGPSTSGGRALTWGGSDGQSRFASVYTSKSSASLNVSANFHGNTGSDSYITSSTGTYGASGIRCNFSNNGDIQFFSDSPASKTAGTAYTPTEVARFSDNGKILAATAGGWVGTVAQSGLSSVIERGSNANGEFVKYADGTMICKGSRSVTVAANSEFTAIQDVPYAASFITAPAVSVGLATNYGNANGFGGVAAASATKFRMYLIRIGSNNNSEVSTGVFCAVGRWY